MTDQWQTGVDMTLSADGSPHVEMRMKVGPWRVDATWPPGHSVLAAPLTLSIAPGESSDSEASAELERGLTTTTLRRIESALVGALGEGRAQGGDTARARQTVIDEHSGTLSASPGPRRDEKYYERLLEFVEALKALGEKQPNRTISHELGISIETVKTQIRAARKQRQS